MHRPDLVFKEVFTDCEDGFNQIAIKYIYAFITYNERGEAIAGGMSPIGNLAYIFSDKRLIKAVLPTVLELAHSIKKKKIKLVKFKVDEIICEDITQFDVAMRAFLNEENAS